MIALYVNETHTGRTAELVSREATDRRPTKKTLSGVHDRGIAAAIARGSQKAR